MTWNIADAESGRGGLRLLLDDLALQAADLEAQRIVARLGQPIVEPADMLDRTQAVHGNAQLDPALQRVGDERNVLQIGQERALGLVVGVGNIVSHQPALAGQLANPRHFNLFLEWEPKASRKGGADSGMLGIRQLESRILRSLRTGNQSAIPFVDGGISIARIFKSCAPSFSLSRCWS